MDHYQPKKYRGIESEHKEVRAKLLQHPSGLKRFLNLSKVLSLNFLHSSLGTGPRPPHIISLTVMDVLWAVFRSTKSLQLTRSIHGPCIRDAVLGSPTSSWSPRGFAFVLPSLYRKLYFTCGSKWLLFEKMHQ